MGSSMKAGAASQGSQSGASNRRPVLHVARVAAVFIVRFPRGWCR
ncbi:MAG: hypothetical protein ACKOTB_06955 [Planctomycetia bacterium]|jgi:hypothetical protein